MNISLLLILIGGGAVAGLLAGLFGIGGGIILVPLLDYCLRQAGMAADSAVRVAIATSLATIIPTSIASWRAHHRRGGVDWVLLKRWMPFLSLGALAGALLASYGSGLILKFCFSLLLFFILWNFLRQKDEASLSPSILPAWLQKLLAWGIGTIAAMLGLGGGAMGVPALRHAGLPLKRAIGTASAFGFVVALPGTCLYLLTTSPLEKIFGGTVGLVQIWVVLVLLPSMVLGARLGAGLVGILPIKPLRYGFALLLFLLASRMLYQVIYPSSP
jgi:uncharacterized protein